MGSLTLTDVAHEHKMLIIEKLQERHEGVDRTSLYCLHTFSVNLQLF